MSDASTTRAWEPVIGLEMHVELDTQTKMFCGCAVSKGDEPNVHTCPVCLAHPGALYPFFGTMLGWLGVALTGSDTASNVLFGSLQKITAEQTGISPILMGAANSSGGVMGKMIDAQSIVVASTATNYFGHEGAILRYLFWHSIALATLMGILVMLQAYVFKWMVVVPPAVSP